MRAVGPIYLAGPTAVGKSDLAVALAERLNGEIIGADAFQVYRGLDLLTAKPDAATLSRVPHHLIGEIPLTETFDVARSKPDGARSPHQAFEHGTGSSSRCGHS